MACGCPQDRLQALFDIGFAGCPGGNADAHGCLALPDGPTAPAGSVLLNGSDHLLGFLRAAKGDQHLVQLHLVKNLISSC